MNPINPVAFVFLILVTLAVLVLLFVIFASISASAQWQFTRIKKGDTVFIAKGDDLKVIIPNIDGHVITRVKDLNGQRWLVRVPGENTNERKEKMREAFYCGLMPGTKWLQWILWDKLGIRFVSWLYPQIKVHKVRISMNRLKSLGGEKETSGAEKKMSAATGTSSLRDRIEFGEDDIDSLRYIIPRPMFIEGIELAGDNSKIDLLVLAIFKLVIPSLPIFYYKGKFMPLLDAAISAGIVDFCAKTKVKVKIKDKDGNVQKDKDGKELEVEEYLTYKYWLEFPKGTGSQLELYLRDLNATYRYYNELKRAAEVEKEKEPIFEHLRRLVGDMFEGESGSGEIKKPSAEVEAKISSGLIPTFGLFLESVRIIDWRIDESTKDLAAAVREKETKSLLAKGVLEEAKGQRSAIDEKSAAEAQRFERMFKALCQSGASPDEALRTLRAVLQAGELKSIPNLQTLVLGQTDTALMVNK